MWRAVKTCGGNGMEWNPSFARLASGFEGLRPSKLYDAQGTADIQLMRSFKV